MAFIPLAGVTGGAGEGLQAAGDGEPGAVIAGLTENPGAGHLTKAGKLAMTAAPGYSQNEAARNRPRVPGRW